MSSKTDVQLAIVTYIKNYIKKNNLAEGDKLPSANMIADLFHVNRNTVRVALAQLSAQGLIYSEQGRGFFVCQKSKPIVFEHDNGMGFSEILDHGTRNYQTSILKYSTISAGTSLAKLFHIEEDAIVHSLKVLRKIDGVPFAICHSYLPDKIVPDFGSHLEQFSSVNKIVIEDYGYSHPQCMKINIEACPPTKEDIEYLDIPVQMPILKQAELFAVSEAGPVEFFVVRARGDRFSFKMSFEN